MLVQPAGRSRLMAVLRRAAMTWGALPVRTWERSSSLSRIRDNDDYAAFGVMPTGGRDRLVGLVRLSLVGITPAVTGSTLYWWITGSSRRRRWK